MAQTFTMTWGAGAVGAGPASVWMATPDIIGFYVDDPPIIPGNIVAGDFSARPFLTWFQTPNTGKPGNPTEWACPLGAARAEVKFSDLPNPAGYLDKVKLHTLANYSVTVGGSSVTPSAVYYRDEAIGQGSCIVSTSGSTQYMVHMRHYVMLKLPSVPTQNAPIVITNTTAGIDPVTFTFNDKTTRAGGIQINQVGQRADDALKYGYLAARIPKGPNNGTVNFATTYGKTSFQILDSSKATVFTGSIVERVDSTSTTGEGYDSGTDVADLSIGWIVTAINKVTSVVTLAASPTHTITVGDKVRFMGINGMTGLENPPATVGGGGLWVAPSVTAVSGNDITISPSISGIAGTFATTTLLSEALGGVNNRVYKCFNTNRAGTYVYGLDFSSWTPSASGTYYVYIPGYGISDPFVISADAWKIAASKLHEGVFNLRHGIAVSSTSGYSRGISLKDGTGGVTNYRSTLVSLFCHECAEAYYPPGSTVVHNGLGGFGGIAGSPVITALTCSGTTATATLAAAHGITVGNTFAITTLGCAPTGYNLSIGIATATGASTFTYPVASGTAATATTIGQLRTGFVTNVRQPNHVGHQDAGDNDDPGIDHFPGWKLLSLAFLACPKPNRFTTFTVPLSSAVLNSTLFAGTDAMPPLFHEMFWYAEAYRLNQMPDGSVWGGHNVSSYNETANSWISSTAPSPETIDKYRGTDARGALPGQKVYAFHYARDHFTNFLYAGYAAHLAMIAYDYGLTTLGNTYRDSAIAAYAWADNLISSAANLATYYKGTLNLKDKCGWSESYYLLAMQTLNNRGVAAKGDAAGALYRLLGQTAGQNPYGNFIEHRSAIGAPTVANGGTGHAIGDVITLGYGAATGTVKTQVFVTGVSAGVITSVLLLTQGQFSTLPTNPMIQESTTGTGTGAQFTVSFNFKYADMRDPTVSALGSYNYCTVVTTPETAAKTYMKTRFATNPTQPAVGLNPVIPYQGLYGTSTSGNMNINAVPTLYGHLSEVNNSGIVTATRTSGYIQLLQAAASFIQGANLQNKCFVTGLGARPSLIALHEDSYRMNGVPPAGLNPFGYYAWASSLMFTSFGGSLSGSSQLDHVGYYITDNVSGANEVQATPGSAKMWNPWRGGSSYWEWSPENRGIIFNSEFQLKPMLGLLATQLYLHGWDGNT